MKLHWILLSALMGVVAALLFILAYTIQNIGWILATIVFVVTFLFFIFRNPALWYRRMAASMILAWITSTFIPIKSLSAVLEHYGVDIRADFPQPTALYHIGFMFIIAALLVFDYLMRTTPDKQLSEIATSSKPIKPPEQTIEQVKETVLAIIERSSIAAKQKEKLKGDIDFTITQIQTHVRTVRSGGLKNINLLSPLNTAVRSPFTFKWELSDRFMNSNDVSDLMFKLIISRENSNDIVFETSIKNSTFQSTAKLVERLNPGLWYTWTIQVLDKENNIVTSSEVVQLNSRFHKFKLFSENETLELLLQENRKKSVTDFIATALIYETFELRKDALNEIEKALKIVPNDAYAVKFRKRIIAAQGKVESGHSRYPQR